jgi:hypothetical protein
VWVLLCVTQDPCVGELILLVRHIHSALRFVEVRIGNLLLPPISKVVVPGCLLASSDGQRRNPPPARSGTSDR